MYEQICAQPSVETTYILTSHNQITHSPKYMCTCMCAYVHIPLYRLHTSPQATIKQHTLLNICALRRVSYLIVACENVYSLYRGLCTDCAHIFRRVCCLIVACGDVQSLYRGMCTYPHMHRYLAECVD
jgi:hypothetical protein